jgi:hypothetical protein
MKKIILIIAALTFNGYAQAKPSFTGQDFSGVYDCTGEDAHEGHYKGTVTLTLKPEQSTAYYGAYFFKLEAQGFGVYPGEAAADGDKMAIHFALNQPDTKDAGTGIASFKKNAQGKYTFHKFYYESGYKGGNHGFEDCVQR